MAINHALSASTIYTDRTTLTEQCRPPEYGIYFWFEPLRLGQQLWSVGSVSSPNHTFFLGKLD